MADSLWQNELICADAENLEDAFWKSQSGIRTPIINQTIIVDQNTLNAAAIYN